MKIDLSVDRAMKNFEFIKECNRSPELVKAILRQVFNDGRLYQIREDRKIIGRNLN